MMHRLMRPLLCVFALCGIGNVAAESVPHGAVSSTPALSPSAPVRLEYELPEILPASGELTLTLNLSSPLKAGELSFEVVSSTGISVIGGNSAIYGLAHAAQPIPHPLKLLLSADSSRFLLVQLSVNGAIGPSSRSYRIDLSLPVSAQPAAKSALKMLPATIRR